jgi:DNA-directed RNA polymerase subunit RPC12/RpoP
MKSAETQQRSPDVQCPHCNGTMPLVRDIAVNGVPNIHLYYCNRCQHVETVKEDRWLEQGHT